MRRVNLAMGGVHDDAFIVDDLGVLLFWDLMELGWQETGSKGTFSCFEFDDGEDEEAIMHAMHLN